MSEKKPFEIARETLKQLTTQKLAPTPANYQAIYNEIAGIPVIRPFRQIPCVILPSRCRSRHQVSKSSAGCWNMPSTG
jgi:hypothetical protein